MKQNSQFLRSLAALAGGALLLPRVACAQTTSYTGTGWVNQVLAPGIVCVNGAGQVLLRGIAYTIRVECTDPRLTGRHTAFADGYVQPGGSTMMYGTAYYEPGTWDAAGSNFTPSGGIWEMKYRGVMQTNNSTQVSHAGYGSGGTIEGLRLQETATRGPATSFLDPTVPLLYSGTIQPPPVSTNLFADSFDSGVNGWWADHLCGSISLYGTNGYGGGTNRQLYTRADFSGCAPNYGYSFFTADHSCTPWNLADGQTLECRADLLRISVNPANAALINAGSDPGGEYVFYLSPIGVGLHKWTQAKPFTFFWWDNTVRLACSNVVLSLSVTRDKANAVITTRVLDKTRQNAVLFERTFVDTPGVEPSLTTAQFRALTGLTTGPSLTPDPGAPIFSGNKGDVGVFQFTDGPQPPVEAIWDNFSLCRRDGPPLHLVPTVELTWTPPADVNYTVEGAPTLEGPWLPVQELAMPGLQKQTVPLNGPAQFFRLIQAP